MTDQLIVTNDGRETTEIRITDHSGTDKIGVVDGNTSDGDHTFSELYDHRHTLFALVLRLYAPYAWKTLKNDKGVQWAGWFICGFQSPYGQVSYHMPMSWWQRLSWVKEIEYNANYDGHNSDDVVERLRKMALYGFEGVG